jgi:phenylacetate-CoA ligase
MAARSDVVNAPGGQTAPLNLISIKHHLAKLSRKIIRAQLARSSPAQLLKLGERRLLRCFQRAATLSPAYRVLLAEAGVDARRIDSISALKAHCPLLEKANTFGRFKLSELLASDIKHNSIASVLTSSGHGGNGYALGLSTRSQLASTPGLIDLGLDMAFDVDRYCTLLINCLPMGVTFQSNAVCVANVSVREDMACAIVEQSGDLFDQIILCGDPLFLKRLCDYSQARSLDWGSYRMNAIIGEETFTESFREYLAGVLGIDLTDPRSGLIGSSMGVGELGLNLFNETRETIAVRQACNWSPQFLAELCGTNVSPLVMPTFMSFNPLRTFVEVIEPDANGIGDLVVTVMDSKTPVPLIRYRTGDRAALINHARLVECMVAHGVKSAAPTLPVVALHGRAKDCLPGGWHVDVFKQAIYQHADVARWMSGAFRVSRCGEGLLFEVQLGRDTVANCEAVATLLHHQLQISRASVGLQVSVKCFEYANFPYAQTIDYERKFTYWAG